MQGSFWVPLPAPSYFLSLVRPFSVTLFSLCCSDKRVCLVLWSSLVRGSWSCRGRSGKAWPQYLLVVVPFFSFMSCVFVPTCMCRLGNSVCVCAWVCVCVCACVCVCVCVHACARACVHWWVFCVLVHDVLNIWCACLYICVFVWNSFCLYCLCVHVDMFVHVFVYIVCVRTWICLCMCLFILFVCAHGYVCACVCLYCWCARVDMFVHVFVYIVGVHAWICLCMCLFILLVCTRGYVCAYNILCMLSDNHILCSFCREGLGFYSRLHDNVSKLRKRVFDVTGTRSREREAATR